MKRRKQRTHGWFRSGGIALLAACLIAAAFSGASSVSPQPADAQGICQAGYTYTGYSCVPSSAYSYGGCPAGYALSSACLPFSSYAYGYGTTTCTPQYTYGGTNCVPSSSYGYSTTCSSGYSYNGSSCVLATSTITTPSTALFAGCNEVVPPYGMAPNTPVTTFIAWVQPNGIVVSAWAYDNSLHGYDALYFIAPGAPTNGTTVQPNQSVFVCVNANGTFAPLSTGTSAGTCQAGYVYSGNACVPSATTYNNCPTGFVNSGYGCGPSTASNYGYGNCAFGSLYSSFGCGAYPLSTTTTSGCPTGYMVNGSVCIPTTATTYGVCQAGFTYSMVYGCAPVPTGGICPSGFTLSGSTCVPNNSIGSCLPGYIYTIYGCIP